MSEQQTAEAMGPKYCFTGETKIEFGVTFKRIRALVTMAAIGVTAGDLGGWIEKESNLSQVYGDAWVSGNARVYDNARVYGNAWVSGNARVYDNARVYGNAWVSGNAQVYGDAWVEIKIICATRTDGYTFVVTPCADGVPRIIAGCRYFTFPEAYAHWSTKYVGELLGRESLLIVGHLERMAIAHGWAIDSAAQIAAE